MIERLRKKFRREKNPLKLDGDWYRRDWHVQNFNTPLIHGR